LDNLSPCSAPECHNSRGRQINQALNRLLSPQNLLRKLDWEQHGKIVETSGAGRTLRSGAEIEDLKASPQETDAERKSPSVGEAIKKAIELAAPRAYQSGASIRSPARPEHPRLGNRLPAGKAEYEGAHVARLFVARACEGWIGERLAEAVNHGTGGAIAFD
jgi:hypothetical protein